MRCIVLILISLSININSYSQIDSTKVSFVSYWSMNDSFDFKITKIQKSWVNDKLTKNDSTYYIANFKVIDSTLNSYKIEWKYKNPLIDIFRNKMEEYNESQETIDSILKNYNISSIVYKTNEIGEFLGVENWKELSNLTVALISAFEKNSFLDNPTKKKEFREMLIPLTEIYSSKEGIEQIILSELQFFHYPFGYEYDTAKPLEYDIEFDNIVGEGTIKGTTKLSVENVDFENYFCTLVEKTSINENDAKKAVLELLLKMKLPKDDVSRIISNAKMHVSEINRYQYYYDPGIPYKISATKNIILKIDNSDQKRTEKTIIELVNDEWFTCYNTGNRYTTP